MNDLESLDIERIAKAIEADAGEPLQDIRQALAEAKAGEGIGQGRVTAPERLAQSIVDALPVALDPVARADRLAQFERRFSAAVVYPALADVKLTHAWGGYVGITLPRTPFVREVMPNVTSIGGFSGHGVMLSNFTGRLYAETLAGNDDKLRALRDLKIPPFPGGRRFRAPLLFLALNWYALRDRI